uniref:Apea-like HEPN domain-containing protein n=1 Tax=Mycobacterium riyadhense TaxID=486698 RepID=A0A653EDX5_9MYCO|nr:hypothetical protein BIN_B_01018 [Mycobacterium riyadhense]
MEANITTFTQGTEPTGAPLWDGEVPGLHRRLRNFILRTPENPITQPHLRRARSGELDIWFSFDFDLDPPDALVEALRSKAYQILALLNLGLGDFLIPVLPFQIREMLPGDQASLKFRMDIAVQAQQELSDSKLIETQMGTAHFLTDPSFGEKYRVALELYAAHITEAQVRVRFILLVIAMEALSEKTYKHQVARDLLHRWKQELKAEKSKYDRSSEEFKSLNDLHSEIKWRGESSLGDGIRKLFVGLPAVTEEELEELQRRAMVVYRKRSTLVHEGYVPVEELPGLEREARELLEVLFSAAMKQSEPEDDRFTIVVEDHPPGPASGGDNE